MMKMVTGAKAPGAVAPAFTPSVPITRSAPLVGSTVSKSYAEVSRANPVAARRRPRVTMQLASPQTQIGRPKTSIDKNIGTTTNAPEREPEAGRGSAKARPTRKTQADEVPMYKVILLGDEEYEEGHVVTQLQKVCQINKNEAARIFAEAQATGSSVVCVVPEEHAEFYVQQLVRNDVFCTLEKDE